MDDVMDPTLTATQLAKDAKGKPATAKSKKRRSIGDSPVLDSLLTDVNEVVMSEDPMDSADIHLVALLCDLMNPLIDPNMDAASATVMPCASVSASGMKSLYALFTPPIAPPIIPIAIERPGYEDFPIHIVDGRKRVRIEFFTPADIRELFTIAGRIFPFEVSDRDVPLYAVAALRNDSFNSEVLVIVRYNVTRGKVCYAQTSGVGPVLLAELISGGPGCLESVLASAPDWFSSSLAKAMKVADDLAFWTLTELPEAEIDVVEVECPYFRVGDGQFKLQMNSKAFNLIANSKPSGANDELKSLIDQSFLSLKLDSLPTSIDAVPFDSCIYAMIFLLRSATSGQFDMTTRNRMHMVRQSLFEARERAAGTAGAEDNATRLEDAYSWFLVHQNADVPENILELVPEDARILPADLAFLPVGLKDSFNIAVFELQSMTDLNGVVGNAAGYLTFTNYTGLGDGFTLSDLANILVFPMLVIDNSRMAWLLSIGGDAGIMQHVSTAMVSARDMIFQNVRAKVGSTRVSPILLTSRSFEPLRETGDPWFASHVMINNMSHMFRKDPDHAVGAVVVGLASVGVTMTAKFVRTQMDNERNRLMMGGRFVYVLLLPVPILKGGGPPSQDDMSSMLRRQRFVTIFSDGKEWVDRPDKVRKFNLEFVADDIAPFLESATFVGSIRGCDTSDSGICGSLHMVTRTVP